MNVLVIFPHADDETYSSAATLRAHHEAGDRIIYACLTDGQNGRNLGKPIVANRETLRYVRRREMLDAAQIIGIDEVIFGGMYDKMIQFMPTAEGVHYVRALIEAHKPDRIYTFYPGFAVHSDHDTTGAWVVEAVKQLPLASRPDVYMVAFSKDALDVLGRPHVETDIMPYIHVKLEAIRAHASQTSSTIADLEKKVKKKDKNILAWLARERYYILER
ncbi:MAG: bacillithiol biosynthesis deacetylase BshB2 [Bacilli bacterium]